MNRLAIAPLVVFFFSLFCDLGLAQAETPIGTYKSTGGHFLVVDRNQRTLNHNFAGYADGYWRTISLDQRLRWNSAKSVWSANGTYSFRRYLTDATCIYPATIQVDAYGDGKYADVTVIVPMDVYYGGYASECGWLTSQDRSFTYSLERADDCTGCIDGKQMCGRYDWQNETWISSAERSCTN